MKSKTREKVLVGMSGGVDSSVSAYLLKQEGYEVVGVSLNLYSCNKITGGCCASADRVYARLTCEQLGIAHYTVDARRDFKHEVVDPFIEDYINARTPSPCILCNHKVKFALLLQEAQKLGAAYIATGHYARTENVQGRLQLLRGVDLKKDQSYFLFALGRDLLEKTIFPLGKLTKSEVRKIAADEKLPSHQKPESQEICFVPDDDYVAYLEGEAGGRLSGEGNFEDSEGKILGKHRGIHSYTIGQRRGLGVSSLARLYVIRIDAKRNAVVLGSEEELNCRSMVVRDPSWICGEERTGASVMVKIRSTHAGVKGGLIKLGDGKLRVEFEEPVKGVAPGQATVFYDGDVVLGGGWIEEGLA